MNGSWLALGAAGILALVVESRRRGSASIDPSYASWLAAWEAWAKEGGRLDVPGLSDAEREQLVMVDWCMENQQTDLTRGSPWAHRFSVEQRGGNPRRFGAPALGKPDLGLCPLPPDWHWPRWAWPDGPRAVRRMYVKIKDNPVVTGGSGAAADFRRQLEALAGEIVEIDTQFLFRDQFNTVEPRGLRLMTTHVAEVINDARPGRGRCNWCGNIVSEPDMGCAHCALRGGESRREARERGIDVFIGPTSPDPPAFVLHMVRQGRPVVALPVRRV